MRIVETEESELKAALAEFQEMVELAYQNLRVKVEGILKEIEDA